MMGDITINRAVHDTKNPYVMTKRESAQDTGLTYEATGMLVFLLSKPDDWQIIPQTLVRDGCTLKRVYAIFKELIDAKYMSRDAVRNERGQFVEWSYHIFEHPLKQGDEPLSKNPQHGQSMTWDSHQVENPQDGFSAALQNKEKEVQNTEIQNTKNTTTALVPVANPEQGPGEVVVSSGVYVIPALTEVDLWEFNARTLPAEIEPPAHKFEFKAKASEVKPSAQSKPVDSGDSSAPPPTPSPLPDTGLAECIKAYEDNIGLIVPMIADAIKGALTEFPAAWIIDAIEIAVEQNVRKWSYVVGILERWRVRGKQATPVKFIPATTDKPADDFDPFSQEQEVEQTARLLARTSEPVDPDWQTLGRLIQDMSKALYHTLQECKFGGVKDGTLTVIVPDARVFSATYGLRRNRWLFQYAEGLWGGIRDVEFVLEGELDAHPETG